MQSQHFKTIASYWDNLDVALVGIGSPAIRDGANWHAFYGSEESDDLNARHVAGDICSRFYNIDGALVETNMSEKRSLSRWRNSSRRAIRWVSPWARRNTPGFLAH
jgi:DNA-binding transcriptional regulator LsrR (DeoR family)